MNVFRPIREWLQQTRQTPKTSTPISAPILRSSSANGHLRHHANNVAALNGNPLNGDALIKKNHTDSSNSYGGDSLTGSSGDMLSSANPTPIHQQNHDSMPYRFTPITNFNNGTPADTDQGGDGGGASGSGGGSMLNSLDDQMNGSHRLGNANEVSGMGSTIEINQQFSRSAQARMSLPIMQQNKLRRQAYTQLQRRGQNQITRSMGHIYLQHKGETKQANLPNELTTIDTIRALFVCAFPHMLTMEYMSQPHVKIYIYNPSCNIFYELCDIEDVRHESVLRIHHSDPLASIALTSQVSMASLGAGGLPSVGPIAHQAHNPYSTMNRVSSRLPPQQTILPNPRQQQQQHRNRNQFQQQAASIGPPPQALMMPHHMVNQSMMMPQHQHHHPLLHRPMPCPPMQQLSQIPPPKPRRMIPASYSLHRLPPSQTPQ